MIARALAAALLLLLPMCGFAAAGTTMTLAQIHELFQAGNSAYQQQKFEEAYSKYVQVAHAGVGSEQLYYNLGTACARINKKAEAVLYLTRARELDPHDPDITANLRRVAPAGVLAALSAKHPVQWTANRLSLREWGVIFFTLYLAAGVAGGFYLSRSRPRPKSLRVAALLLAGASAIVVVFAGRKYHETYNVQYAVIARAAASVRSGPAEKFAQVDTMPEGEIVKSLGYNMDGWSHVQLPDGRRGYLPSGQLLLI